MTTFDRWIHCQISLDLSVLAEQDTRHRLSFQRECGLWVVLPHLVVLLNDLETVRDFMLEPEYTQEEATVDTVRQIQVVIYRL